MDKISYCATHSMNLAWILERTRHRPSSWVTSVSSWRFAIRVCVEISTWLCILLHLYHLGGSLRRQCERDFSGGLRVWCGDHTGVNTSWFRGASPARVSRDKLKLLAEFLGFFLHATPKLFKRWLMIHSLYVDKFIMYLASLRTNCSGNSNCAPQFPFCAPHFSLWYVYT